ncbi:MAG TPA: hypothetical protein VNW46_14920 [Gemmatimonadaceae bacterium]|nr:hypothetical protein [Gemmatimonadaceae bacterium]
MMYTRPLLVLLFAVATPTFAQSGRAAADSDAQMKVERQARDAVAADSTAIDAIRNDPNASGQDYNRAVLQYREARSLLKSGDYGAATDSAAHATADAAQGGRDVFDRQSQSVGAAPMRDSTVDNTQRAVPDAVPQRTFRDSTVFGAGKYSPDGVDVPQRSFRDSLPDGVEKAQPVNQTSQP